MGLAARDFNIPVWEKLTLTFDEAAAYSGIGLNKLREITTFDNCEFVLVIGRRKLIKRVPFEKYIESAFSI